MEDAEAWLDGQGLYRLDEDDDFDVNPAGNHSEEKYQECARLAHEINEIAGLNRLADLLSREKDHAFLCRIGVWYWSLGHLKLAKAAYQHSIQISPDTPTFFNLAICCDDMDDKNHAETAMKEFYKLVSSKDERKLR